MNHRNLLTKMTGLTFTVLLFVACGTSQSAPIPIETLEENKATIRRWVEEGANKQNLDIANETVASDMVYHDTDVRGVEGFKQNFSALFAAFPDGHWTIDDHIAEGDKVVARMIFQGTHKGEWMGIPSTGKRVTWATIVIFRLTDGKIVELWGIWDAFGFFQQLDLMPPM